MRRRMKRCSCHMLCCNIHDAGSTAQAITAEKREGSPSFVLHPFFPPFLEEKTPNSPKELFFESSSSVIPNPGSQIPLLWLSVLGRGLR
jgi:hypothetical protein